MSRSLPSHRNYQSLLKAVNSLTKLGNLFNPILRREQNKKRMIKRSITPRAKKILFGKAANRCSFPECNSELVDTHGNVIGEICHIKASHPNGPRYDPLVIQERLFDEENLIALCPTHHRLIDVKPYIYTADWLQKAKAAHEKAVKETIEAIDFEPVPFEAIKTASLTETLKFWSQNESNADEEFWQRLLHANPRIIAQAVPEHIQIYDQKCYVGGKSISNRGGNIVDFLYTTKPNNNVVLIEIKTPATRLLGKKYRTNAYSITEEISGAVVQVLNYRDELLKNYYHLVGQSSEIQFNVFNPQCLIIAGNLNIEMPNATQRKSFDLFRSSLGNVRLITFDELFEKLKDTIDLGS